MTADLVGPGSGTVHHAAGLDQSLLCNNALNLPQQIDYAEICIQNKGLGFKNIENRGF